MTQSKLTTLRFSVIWKFLLFTIVVLSLTSSLLAVLMYQHEQQLQKSSVAALSPDTPLSQAPPKSQQLIALSDRLLFGLVLGVLVGSGSAVFLARSFKRPIDELKHAANQVKSGKYEHRIRSTRTDELGELSNAFDSMTDQLEIALEELNQSNRELANRATNLKSLARFAELNPNLAFRIDRNGFIIQRNPASTEFIGKLSRDTNISSLIPSLDREQIASLIDADDSYSITGKIGGKWMQFRVIGLKEFNALQVYGTDITELVEIQDAIQTEKEKAETASKTKTRFLATMSHELRTPLNAILGFNQHARKKNSSSEVDSNLCHIEVSAQKLLGMIEQLLDYTQFEDFNIELHKRVFDMNSLSNDLLKKYDNIAREKQLNFDLQRNTDEHIHYVGDYNRIKQMLDYLLDNAFKFTNSGLIQLLINQSDGRNIIEFKVIDSGPGIPDEQKDHVFEAFSKTQASVDAHRDGSGIGLSLCRKISQAMGSDIELTDKPEGGSIFRFSLALDIASEEERLAYDNSAYESEDSEDFDNIELFLEESDEAAALESFSSEDLEWNSFEAEHDESAIFENTKTLPHTIKVLVVEDNTVNRELIKLILDDIDSEYQIAVDGKQALSTLEDFKPDVILMDKQMPVMDGVEATRRIRSTPEISDIPIIAVTANVMTQDKQACFDAGMNAFVSKPIDSEYLYSVMEELTGISVSEHPSGNTQAEELFSLDNAKHFYLDDDTFYSELKRFIDNFEILSHNDTERQKQLHAIQNHDLCLAVPEYFHIVSETAEDGSISETNSHKLTCIHQRFIASIQDCLQPNTNINQNNYSLDVDIEGLNSEDALARFHGNQRRYFKMLKGFSENHSTQLYYCRLHLLRGATDDARRCAHTTKGLAATIGADALQDISKKLEYALSEDQSDIDELLAKYETVFSDCVNRVRFGIAANS